MRSIFDERFQEHVRLLTPTPLFSPLRSYVDRTFAPIPTVCSCDWLLPVQSNKNTILISITQTETPNRHEPSKLIITLAP